MKALVYTFLALFIWTLVPTAAIASRGDRGDRHAATYRENTDHHRHGKRHEFKKHQHREHRKAYNHRPQHWHGTTTRVKYVPYPVYRSYDIPSGYVYSTSPGVTLYFSW